MNGRIEKKCPVCGGLYDSSLLYCTKDGQALIPFDPLIGQVLDERYRIESVLGQGGMGVVYKATHIHIDTEYAVKVLNPELVANQSAIERFRIEARAAGRIRHPNAIQVTDFGITPERVVYLVMEMVEGVSLRRLLEESKVFDLRRAGHILGQACGAVEAAHQRGVIHRDLKPDNILITREGGAEVVKVCDFGIAKLKNTSHLAAAPSAPLTQAGTLIGTPEYMSPEQCRGHQLDPRSDVYSLGIILYEMLCGQLPFAANSVMDVMFKHLNEQAPPLREVAASVPAPVEQVVLRALEKDAEKRQPSAADLSSEFNAAVGAAASGTPPGGGQVRETLVIGQSHRPSRAVKEKRAAGAAAAADVGRAVTRSSGNPRKMALAAAAVLVIGLVGFGAYSAFSPVPPSPTPAPPPAGMALIPGGKFTMGRDNGPEEERPAHVVAVAPFYIDQYEVTNEAYKKFADATQRRPPKHWLRGDFKPGEATLPVTHVTWRDAADYAAWAGKRLPKEEEWEYVARGGDKEFLFPWGNEWKGGYANVRRPDGSDLAPVGSFRTDRSPFGDVYDLAGNVSEWVEDSYRKSYDAQFDSRLKMIRGGNIAEKQPLTSTSRKLFDFPETPQQAGEEQDLYTNYTMPKVGFRCAKDVGR